MSGTTFFRPVKPRPGLEGDAVADWLVVGAGYAGLAAAQAFGLAQAQ